MRWCSYGARKLAHRASRVVRNICRRVLFIETAAAGPPRGLASFDTKMGKNGVRKQPAREQGLLSFGAFLDRIAQHQ
jgi:hypothetical protein